MESSRTLKPLRLLTRPGGSIFTDEISSVICDNQIVSVKDTILDPQVIMEGADVDLPVAFKDLGGRPIKSLRLHPLGDTGRLTRTGGMIFLSSVSISFNAILRKLAEPQMDEGQLQKLINTYYRIILSKMKGQKGVVARGVIGTRMPHSGRLVLSTAIDRHPKWVGLHRESMERAGIKEGSMVLIYRDPVIWAGSIAVLLAYPIEDPVMALHPLHFKSMGADMDGDAVVFVRPRLEDDEVRAECEKNLCRFAMDNATWPASLCGGGFPAQPDWNNIEEDTARRFKVTGLSYGPLDVSHKHRLKGLTSETLVLEEQADKKFGEKNWLIAKGDPDTARKIILDTNFQQLVMKLDLGYVGALSRRILLLAGADPWISKPASILSEALQQSKLNAKHDAESLDGKEVADLFERSGKWREATVAVAMEELKKVGIGEEVRPIVTYLFVEIPYLLMLDELGMKEELLGKAKRVLREVVKKNPKQLPQFRAWVAEKANRSLKEIEESLKETKTIGIRALVELWYPGYSFITPSTWEEDLTLNLYHRVFVRKTKDRGGIFRIIQDALEDDVEELEVDWADVEVSESESEEVIDGATALTII